MQARRNLLSPGRLGLAEAGLQLDSGVHSGGSVMLVVVGALLSIPHNPSFSPPDPDTVLAPMAARSSCGWVR